MTDQELEKIYRPSATLIIVAKSSCKQGYNYRLLLAKRSSSIAFAPDHYVFPGGVYDPTADENMEWLEYFKSFGICQNQLEKLSLKHLPNRPSPLMTNGVNFSRDISLRITAIREAFEEVGLLLCVDRNDLKRNRASAKFIHNFDRSHWQREVHTDAKKFLNLCKYLNVVPDLWCIYEWSIWRSPQNVLKKYDTAIYVATLTDMPQLLLEPTEVENELWLTPPEALKLFKNRTIFLAPVQFYEISRLCNCLEWEELETFVKKRSSKGSTLITPAYFKCLDCIVGVLPGDDCYTTNALHHTSENTLSLTEIEFRTKTKNIHRITFYDMYNLFVSSNIIPIDDHLSPVLQMDKSKL